MTIRQEISKFLEVLIPAGKWDEYIEELNKEGIPNRKQLLGIIIIICKHIEALEKNG